MRTSQTRVRAEGSSALFTNPARRYCSVRTIRVEVAVDVKYDFDVDVKIDVEDGEPCYVRGVHRVLLVGTEDSSALSTNSARRFFSMRGIQVEVAVYVDPFFLWHLKLQGC